MTKSISSVVIKIHIYETPLKNLVIYGKYEYSSRKGNADE